MSEAEKKVVSSDPSLELEPVNMYVLFARMFADIAREVEADFGEAGIQAVRRGDGPCQRCGTLSVLLRHGPNGLFLQRG